jgi:hypothetical protein
MPVNIVLRVIRQILKCFIGYRANKANEISGHLVRKVPALQQVIEDILDDVEPDLLDEHLNRMISLLQHRNLESFKNWRMPPLTSTIRSPGIDGML